MSHTPIEIRETLLAYLSILQGLLSAPRKPNWHAATYSLSYQLATAVVAQAVRYSLCFDTAQQASKWNMPQNQEGWVGLLPCIIIFPFFFSPLPHAPYHSSQFCAGTVPTSCDVVLSSSLSLSPLLFCILLYLKKRPCLNLISNFSFFFSTQIPFSHNSSSCKQLPKAPNGFSDTSISLNGPAIRKKKIYFMYIYPAHHLRKRGTLNLT